MTWVFRIYIHNTLLSGFEIQFDALSRLVLRVESRETFCNVRGSDLEVKKATSMTNAPDAFNHFPTVFPKAKLRVALLLPRNSHKSNCRSFMCVLFAYEAITSPIPVDIVYPNSKASTRASNFTYIAETSPNQLPFG